MVKVRDDQLPAEAREELDTQIEQIVLAAVE